jgi:ribosomal protein S18 acetylase RimI-like enzyme
LTHLHASLDLARRVDRAEIDFCALAGTIGSPSGVVSLEAGGGRALFGRTGSPLNKVLGLGLHGPVSDRDLDRIEEFYADRKSPVQVELCPLAASNLAPRLIARGYVVQAFENELARTIPPSAHETSTDSAPRVVVARPEEDNLWIRVTAEGFAAFEPPVGGGSPGEVPGIDMMIEMMSQFAHPNITRYLALVGDEPAGGGAAWSHEGVLGIFGTATLPAFRRQGVQRAVTLQAMKDAGDADLAIATTAPGSTSQRTFERLGFHVIYTRAIFVKEPAV